MTPKILISGSDISRVNYENAVSAAYGSFASFYLPKQEMFQDVLQTPSEVCYEICTCLTASYDGLLLAGGGDVNPILYGQEPNGSGKPDDARDCIELNLIHAFMEAGKPILGICRGFQIMNIALGGTLHQDIGEMGHKIHTPEHPKTDGSVKTVPNATIENAPVGEKAAAPVDKVHLTRSVPSSFLGKLYSPIFSTNSAHHQSIDRLAEPLLAVEWAIEDGGIEGAFHPAYPYIGIQWHPERMCLAKKREDTVDGLALFQYFMKTFF